MKLLYRIYSVTNSVSITSDNTPSRKWFDGTNLYTLKNFEEDDYTKQNQAMKIITNKLDNKISDAELAQYLIDLYIKMVSKQLSQVECNIELSRYMYVIDRVLPRKVKNYTKYMDYIITMKRRLCDIILNRYTIKCDKNSYIMDRVCTYRQCIGNDNFAFQALYHYEKKILRSKG